MDRGAQVLSSAPQAAPAAYQMGNQAWSLRGAPQAALAGNQIKTSCGPQVSRAARQAGGRWGLRRCMQPAPRTAQALGVCCKAAALAGRLPGVGPAGRLRQEEQGLPAQMQTRRRQAAG